MFSWNNGVWFIVFRKGAKMSSKVDTLLKKAASFEKLALYGDRRAYLTALAQAASLPDVKALANLVNATRVSIVRALNSFWRQNPDTFPLAVRTDYSALAYPDTDVTTAQGEQVSTAMNQLLAAASSAYRGLSENNDRSNQEFAQKTLYPLQQKLESQINQYNDAMSAMQVQPGGEGEEGPEDKLQIPEQTIVGELPPQINPASLKAVQTYLKITSDGKWGPETSGAVKNWGNTNNMKGQSTQAIVDAIRARAMGNQVANKVQTGPNLEQSRRNPL